MKQAAPAHIAQHATLAITKPHKPRLAYHMVYRYKAPIPGIKRIVTVVAHHPVIVHFKSIGCSFFTIDDEFAMLLF